MAEKVAIDEGFSRLPLEGNWRYRPYNIATFTLAPGESRIIMDLRRHGWVLSAAVAHNNPDMSCTIELETGTENYIESFTTNDLFNLGFVQPAPTSWWVSIYNTILNAYVVAFTPATWWPFYRRIKVTLENKTSTPVTISRVAVLCIEFVEGAQ